MLRAIRLMSFLLCAIPLLAQPVGWRQADSMSRFRAGHDAVLLTTGELLVAGGINAGGEIAASEIFDPETGQWRTVGGLSQARRGLRMVLLGDGRVLAAGGLRTGQPSARSDTFSPINEEWSRAGDLEMARESFTLVSLSGSRALAAGGFGMGAGGGFNALTSVEIFDLATREWTAGEPMSQARQSHTATRLDDGRVLVCGGFSAIIGGLFGRLSSCEIYHPAAGSWSATGSMRSPRAGHEAIKLQDGRVLVVGGGSPRAETWDPLTGEWTMSAQLPGDFTRHRMVLLADGRALVTGGNDQGTEARAFFFDPDVGGFSDAGQMLEARQEHTADRLPSGEVLVAGGLVSATPSVYHRSAELFLPGPPAPATRILYPQLALGGGFEVALLLSNLADISWSGEVLLDGGNWPPDRLWTLNGNSRVGRTSFDVTLAPRRTLRFVLASNQGPFSGFLEIRPQVGFSLDRVASSFFYQFSSGDELVSSTGVGPAGPGVAVGFPVETTRTVETGIALRRLGAPVQLSLYDSFGQLRETATLEEAGARFVSDIFQSLEPPFTGSVEVRSGVGFYLTVLRQEFLPGPELRFQLTSVPATRLP